MRYCLSTLTFPISYFQTFPISCFQWLTFSFSKSINCLSLPALNQNIPYTSPHACPLEIDACTSLQNNRPSY